MNPPTPEPGGGETPRTTRKRRPRLPGESRFARRRGATEGLSLTHEVPVHGPDILERLVALPINLWTYDFDDPSVRHLGPMAQDFAAAFGLGDSDRMIDLIDANGVTMVAIQALYRRLTALEAEVADLRRRLDETGVSPT